MRTYIVSNHDQLTVQVRQVLLREGIDCPQEQMVPLGVDMVRLRKQDPELIILVLQPETETGLAVLVRLREFVKCQVIAVGPTDDPRLVSGVWRVGVHDYIDAAELASELPVAIQRLRSENAGRAPEAHTIAVYSPSGGCGASTVAANLAVLLAKKDKKTLLIDLNRQTGDLAALLDLKPTHTLADLCAHSAHLDRSMLERTLVPHSSGVHLLAPPLHMADADRITTEGIRQTLSLGRRLFPHVVIDFEHTLTPALEQILHMADLILLVIRLDFTVVRNTRRILEHFERQNLDKSRVRVVANRYGQQKEVPYLKAEEGLGVKIAHYIPEDPRNVNRANNCGIPVVVENAYARSSRSLKKLSEVVAGSKTANQLVPAE